VRIRSGDEEALVDWRQQVAQIAPAEERQPAALDRIDGLLAGDAVDDWVAVVRRDVCDDGHLHEDLGVWLLTTSRLLVVELNDARHLHGPEPHDGTSLHVVQVPLARIDDIALHTWLGDDGDPVALIGLAHRGGRGGGRLVQHDCDDAACEDGGTFQLETWDEGLELSTSGDDAAAVVRFAGALGMAVARRG